MIDSESDSTKYRIWFIMQIKKEKSGFLFFIFLIQLQKIYIVKIFCNFYIQMFKPVY